WTQPAGKALSVAIVQGNFPQEVKWRRDYFLPTLLRYKRLTKHTDADLVVWPEVAIPTIARNAQSYLDSIAGMANDKNQTVLAGTLTQKPHTQSYYNTVLALGAGHGVYHKRHLVPFGEYFPLPDFVKRWMNAIHLRYSSLARGRPGQPL